jgi:hypothetical protein
MDQDKVENLARLFSFGLSDLMLAKKMTIYEAVEKTDEFLTLVDQDNDEALENFVKTFKS